MSLTRRITGGLAWAGLAFFVAVPVADFVTARMMDDNETSPQALNVGTTSRPVVIEPKPVEQVAAVETPAKVETPAADGTASAVDRYLASGKPLPSYLSDADAAAATSVATRTPVDSQPAIEPPTEVAATTGTTAPLEIAPQPPVEGVASAPVTEPATDPVETASVQPELVAPVPMPYEMRPRSVEVGYNQQPSDVYVPPAEGGIITAEDLEDWEFGPLSDFLARRQAANDDAAYSTQVQSGGTYDDNGYYVSDGPTDVQQGPRYIGPVDDAGFFPFLD